MKKTTGTEANEGNEESKKRLAYEELREELNRAPVTWLPGLLANLVVQCAYKNVFSGGAFGVSGYVSDVLANAARQESHSKNQTNLEN